ncbi:TetR family transcriptional regulator C-terminal domain-containing protein [Aquibium microcysteis]|uniref:TetR family transcriptional regulator C-terminal domain-containing protein n=1 Tax=Aquibium microcysteis TaxID=675281 RepID=UPI001AED48DE|nr:TetR family transcriptional regulator C-terminal domain-containing protein [Aquibium microcysteis]
MSSVSKRDRIVSATVDLLLDDGLLSAQTRAVTERAGVGTGLLNHYFRWPDLRAAAWTRIFDGVAADMRRDGEGPTEALERFFAESFAEAARPLWRLWIEAEGLAVQDPPMALAVASARTGLRNRLTAILGEGVEQGEWMLTSPRATALRLEAMRDGLAGLLLADDPELDAAAASDLLRTAFRQETALSRYNIHGED